MTLVTSLYFSATANTNFNDTSEVTSLYFSATITFFNDTIIYFLGDLSFTYRWAPLAN